MLLCRDCNVSGKQFLSEQIWKNIAHGEKKCTIVVLIIQYVNKKCLGKQAPTETGTEAEEP